jgi:hypothetical protein
MRALVRALTMVGILSVLAVGASTLFSSKALADVENPCDPVFGVIKACKDAHGHWDYRCCCCKMH